MDQEVFQQLLLDNADDIIQDLELDGSIRCPDCIINDTEFNVNEPILSLIQKKLIKLGVEP